MNRSSSKGLPTALIILAAAICFHGVIQLLAPGPATIVQPVAAQAPGGSATPGIYYLGRSTYFLTQSEDGRSVYLWYYDFNPVRRNNSVEFLTGATIQ